MNPLLVCCVGNAFLSPVFAALFDAEAIEAGSTWRAISAGLTNRTEPPATAGLMLRGAGRALVGSPALEALRGHRPEPLRARAPQAVSGVLYLHEKARSRRHLLDDAKVIAGWLRGGGAPVVGLATEDAGYRAWEDLGRPDPDSSQGAQVSAAYEAQILSMRTLARHLVATLAVATDTSVALSVIPGTAELPRPIVVLPPAPIVELVRAPRTPAPPMASPGERRPQRSFASVAPVAVRELEAPAASAPLSSTPPEGRRRRVIQLPPPAPPPAAPAPAARPRGRRSASSAPPPSGGGTDREPDPGAFVEAASPPVVRSESGPRSVAVEDVRAWLRAALPQSRAALVRFGLWKRAIEQFGSWDAAVQASGVTPSEPLWKLPRDPEVALDILVEALPDAVVARLAELSIAKVQLHRRQMAGPTPAQQLARRLVATGRLGEVPDEQLARELAVSVAEVVRVREQEGIPGFVPPA